MISLRPDEYDSQHSSSFAFLINSEVKRRVVYQRSIRQGCPLSPYLFFLCGERLSATISFVKSWKRIHGLLVARGATSISHLFFANDSLTFGKANIRESRHLKSITLAYEKASGQLINYDKFVVF